MVLKRSPNRVIGHMIDDVDERLVVNTIATTLSIQKDEEERMRRERVGREREKEWCRPQSNVPCSDNTADTSAM